MATAVWGGGWGLGSLGTTLSLNIKTGREAEPQMGENAKEIPHFLAVRVDRAWQCFWL